MARDTGPAEPGYAADCLQRPLRSRFQRRLTPSVRVRPLTGEGIDSARIYAWIVA